RKVADAKAKVEAVERGQARPAADGADAKRGRQVAALRLEEARADLRSVERRAEAMRATWERSSCGNGAGGEVAEKGRGAARAAARAEREHATARARAALAEAELRLHRATAAKKGAVEKEFASARETLDKALKSAQAPGENYTKFTGARWTPTRFLNSAKD